MNSSRISLEFGIIILIFELDGDEEDEEETSDDDEYENYVNPFAQKYQVGDSTTKSAQEEEVGESSMNDTYEDNEFLKSQMNNDRPISAMPPKVSNQDEAVVEVSSTPAFQCLEEVFYFYYFILVKDHLLSLKNNVLDKFCGQIFG